MSIRSHYDELRVAQDSDPGTIRLAWKRLCQKYHPDKWGGVRRPEFLRIQEAYQVLSSPVERAKYDLWLAREQARARPDEQIRPSRCAQDVPADKISLSALRRFRAQQEQARRAERAAFYAFFNRQVACARRQLHEQRTKAERAASRDVGRQALAGDRNARHLFLRSSGGVLLGCLLALFPMTADDTSHAVGSSAAPSPMARVTTVPSAGQPPSSGRAVSTGLNDVEYTHDWQQANIF